jgi:branched-chain amino acid transport system substrate-binding protein
MKRKNSFLIGFCLVFCITTLFVLLALGAQSAHSQTKGEPIKFGLVVPMTGPLALSGQREEEALKLYVEHINKEGGIFGRRVELYVRNDEAKQETAIKAIRELHDKYDVKFFLGLSASMVVTAVIPELEKLNVIGIGHAQSDSLCGSKGGPNFFRVTSNGYLPNRGLVDVLRERFPNVKKWATISQDYSYGRSCWESFATKFKEVDPKFEIVAEQWPKFGAGGGYGSHINAVINSGAQGLYTSMVGSDWITFVREGKRYGLFDKIAVFAHGNLIYDETAPLKSEMVECWAATQWCTDCYDNPDSRWLKQAYTVKYGELVFMQSQTFISFAYDMMKAYKAALEKAGTDKVADVKKALEGLTYDSLKGKLWIRPEERQGIFPQCFVHIVPDSNHPVGWKVIKSVVKRGEDCALPLEKAKKL